MQTPEAPSPHPFEQLTPAMVMDALSSVGLWADGRLTPLNSFENRVYLAHLDEPAEGHTAVVLKFYRPERWSDAQIEEEHQFALELAADEVPVVPPLVLEDRTLHHHEGFRFSVSPRRGGRRPELDDPDVLEWTGRFIARLHNVGARSPFAQRPTLSLAQHGQATVDWLVHNEAMPLDVQSRWHDTVCQALKTIAQMAPELGNNAHHLRLHGDCHPGNVLWTPSGQPGEGPHFVDLDDALTGPAVQDLWMLLPGGDRQDQLYKLSALLDGYTQVRPFPLQQLRWIEPLRTLRLIHYSGWLARRWGDPAFPANFPWFGSSAYWLDQIQVLQEQIEGMLEPIWTHFQG